MTDQTKRLDVCVSLITPLLNLTIETSAALLYFIPLVYTLRTYGPKIIGINRVLLNGWAFESVILILKTFFEFYNLAGLKLLAFIYWIGSEMLFILFIALMFKLKKLQIYLDPQT